MVFKFVLISGFNVGLNCDFGVACCFEFKCDVDVVVDVAFRFGVEYPFKLEVDAVAFELNVGFACEPNLVLVAFQC